MMLRRLLFPVLVLVSLAACAQPAPPAAKPAAKPATRPAIPNFSSGPCAKRPGWSLDALDTSALGRIEVENPVGLAEPDRAQHDRLGAVAAPGHPSQV